MENTETEKGIAYYITFPEYQAKTEKGQAFPTGHAAVLFVDKDGVTKFREYGRYSNPGKRDGILGRVNNIIKVPNVQMKDGTPDPASLQNVLKRLSAHQYGTKGGRVTAQPYEVEDVEKGIAYADSLYGERLNPLRAQDPHKYRIMGNNCSTFANECINRAGGNAPTWGLAHILPVANTWFNSKDIEYTPAKYTGGIIEYRDGGIYINPKNKGKFTASANRAGMGVQEFANHVLANKEDYSSTQVKRANFARNAKTFKHQDGGRMGYDIFQVLKEMNQHIK